MAAPAAAHDDIVAASPAAGSSIGVGPNEISLTFSGEILTETSAVVIEVIAPDGQNVAVDPPEIDGTTVTQGLAPEQVPGVYTVRWRVVSSDGHPISDEYTYTLEALTVPASTPTPSAAASEQSPEPSPTPTDTSSTSGGHGQPTGGGAALPILAIASGVIILGGILVVVLMVGRERRRRDRAAAESAAAAKTEEGADES